MNIIKWSQNALGLVAKGMDALRGSAGLLVLFVLVACTPQGESGKRPVASDTTGSVSGAQTSAPDDDALAPLVFTWNTEFSSFVSPPMDVRRQARSACNKRGYAIAVMAHITLADDVAEAIFTCRGDTD